MTDKRERERDRQTDRQTDRVLANPFVFSSSCFTFSNKVQERRKALIPTTKKEEEGKNIWPDILPSPHARLFVQMCFAATESGCAHKGQSGVFFASTLPDLASQARHTEGLGEKGKKACVQFGSIASSSDHLPQREPCVELETLQGSHFQNLRTANTVSCINNKL